jgi:predicted metal-dependent hydrolase
MDLTKILRDLGLDLPGALTISARSKRIRLTLRPGPRLDVTLPQGVPAGRLLEVLTAKSDWISRHAAGLNRAVAPRNAKVELRPENLVFPAFEQSFALNYVRKDASSFRLDEMGPGEVLVSGPAGRETELARCLAGFCRVKAAPHLRESLHLVSRETGLACSGMTIRSQRSRWGSCSSRHSLSLNFRLAFLPWDMIRYVLLHELCHTVHLDHSAKFWSFVAKFEPGYKRLRTQLRRAGEELPAWLTLI